MCSPGYPCFLLKKKCCEKENVINKRMYWKSNWEVPQLCEASGWRVTAKELNIIFRADLQNFRIITIKKSKSYQSQNVLPNPIIESNQIVRIHEESIMLLQAEDQGWHIHFLDWAHTYLLTTLTHISNRYHNPLSTQLTINTILTKRKCFNLIFINSTASYKYLLFFFS